LIIWLKGRKDTVKVPCGKRISCRVQRRNDWTVRLEDESRLHDHTVFVISTSDEKNLQKNDSLSKKDFQLFMKRLRKVLYPIKIRFYACDEYGGLTQRAIFFGCLLPKFKIDHLFRAIWEKTLTSITKKMMTLGKKALLPLASPRF
jgi:hypothetical protein